MTPNRAAAENHASEYRGHYRGLRVRQHRRQHGKFLAFVCKRTGKIRYQTDFPDAAELYDELPDDIHDEKKYAALPDKRELGLGQAAGARFCSRVPAGAISKTSAISSAGGVPTRNSRPCSPNEVRSIAGKPSKQKPRSRRCAAGARCIRSKLLADLLQHGR
jgi:hypothetical protein